MDMNYQQLKKQATALSQKLITSADLKKTSAPLGIYEQRNGLFMIRVRVAGGDINADMLSRLSQVCRNNHIDFLHLTTRQDIQLHDVQLEHIHSTVVQAVESGFVFRGGGGDTYRNLVVDEFSDLAPEAVFDVRPYASPLNEVVLAYDPAFALPRKLKIGLFSSPADGNAALFQDIAFVATNGVANRAFDVYAGGGMGRNCRLGVKIFSGLPDREIFHCAVAGIDLFHDHGNREKRHEARLRFVLEKLGEHDFVELYRRYFDRTPAPVVKSPSLESFEKPPVLPEFSRKDENHPDATAWLAASVVPTRFEQVRALKLTVPCGNIEQRFLAPLAALATKYTNGKLRLLRSQDLLLPGVHETALPHLFDEVRQSELAPFIGTAQRCKILSCVGAATCKIGILNSVDFATKVALELDTLFESFPNISCQEQMEITGSIRISGCPNACSCHPAATLGFEGLKRDLGKGVEPCFRVYYGGCMKGADSRLAVTRENFHLPATDLPAFITGIVRTYLSRRKPGESFADFIHRSPMESAANPEL